MDQLLVLFVGLCIAITALPVSIRILMDLGKLDSLIGQRIISAAIFNDVVSLLVLGVILDFKTNSKSYTQLAYSIGFATVKFLALIAIITISYRLIRKSGERITNINSKLNKLLKFLKSRESLFALVMVFVLIFASISELMGLHFVVGAFFGAVLLSKDLLGEERYNEVQKTTSQVTMGFLAPVFFALIGVQFDMMAINNYLLLLLILIASFISKILGGFTGARLAGFKNTEALTLGIGLNARGIMELVIANIALANGFIDLSMFSILVIMGITTTLASPVLLKKAFDRIDKKKTEVI
jgi:Kef-type K+ transport system membrane component KefB